MPVANDTMVFYFEKPRDFEYHAGQTIDLTLVDPRESDTEGNTRTFSLSSAPHERELAISTRLRESAFKRALRDLSEGSEVSMEGPIGNFVLHEKAERPAIFLSGGIGVTPFRSMILDAIERELPHQLHLFYANRRAEDAPHLHELQTLAAQNGTITFVPTLTQEPDSTWLGERGYVTANTLNKYAPDRESAIYYIAGPLAMVAAMHKMLLKAGVSNDDIRVDEFTGY